MEVQAGVVAVRMPVPPTLPTALVVLLDVVYREIARREPSNVEPGCLDYLRVLFGGESHSKESRLESVRVERGLGDERIRREMSFE
nr:hypothetical protein [Haloarchaeobius sp. FL176]